MAEIALRDYIAEIESLIEGNAYDEAVAHCRHILTRYPKYLEAYRLLGKAALEKEDDRAAVDVFQRVLSVDPEDFVARVGLSIVYDRQGALDDALWQMERGFELMPSNDVIQSELRRLYGRRDGVEPERMSLTRGALARMYAQGDLYAEAIAELRTLLNESPERADLRVLLAETLWRDEQRTEAATVAELILDDLPYCLTANLILGEIWLNSGLSEDGETLLHRAQAVDPDNARASALFNGLSPLSEQSSTIERLEYHVRPSPTAEPAVDEVPEWLAGLAGMTLEQPESATAPGLPAPESGPAIELGPAEAGIPDWLLNIEQAVSESAAPVAPPAEMPDWMSGLLEEPQAGAPTQAPPAEMAEPAVAAAEAEALPDWLSEMAAPAEAPPAAAEAALPDWLSEIGAPPVQPAAPEAPPSELERAELPDWLEAMRPPVAEPAPPPVELPEVEAAEVPEWMTEIEEAPARDEAFEFLKRLGDTVPLEPIEAAAPSVAPEPVAPPVSEQPPLPSVEVMPSPEDALAFLESLTAGKEEQLPAEAERAADERVEAIIGGKPGTSPLQPPPQASVPGAAAPPAALEVAAPVAEQPALPGMEGMPSPEDALAFLQSLTVGKEEELRAEAERAGEERMEAIMGGKPGTSPLRPPTGPLAPPAPVEAAAPPVAEQPALPSVEGLPSPEDALAFLQSLTVGKEEELRAEAERAGEERMEAIMGGKPGTSPLRPPTGPLAPPAAPPEVAVPPEVPVEELPSAEEALEFLEGLTAGPSETPAEVAEPTEAELATRPLFEPATWQPAEDALSFLEEITAELQPPTVEVPPAALETAAHIPALEQAEAVGAGAVVDFWLQTADDEGGESIGADYFERAARQQPSVPVAQKVEVAAPPVATPVAEAPAAPMPPPVGAYEYEARLQANPADHEARLSLARIWWASADRARSLQLYQVLIDEEMFLGEIAADLQRDVETYEHPDWYRALGDAHMKLGNLARALDAYRQALTHL